MADRIENNTGDRRGRPYKGTRVTYGEVVDEVGRLSAKLDNLMPMNGPQGVEDTKRRREAAKRGRTVLRNMGRSDLD